MQNVTTPPIPVTTNSAAPTALTGIQYAVAALGGYAVGKGWLVQGDVEAITAIIGIVVPAAIGVYKAWKNNEQKKTLADYVPDSVAFKK